MLKLRRELEILMRLSPLVLVLGLAASSLAVPVVGQKPDDQIAARSIEFQKQGEAALAAGKLMEADDALETALAVDPRNRAAFVAMEVAGAARALSSGAAPPVVASSVREANELSKALSEASEALRERSAELERAHERPSSRHSSS